MSDSTGSKKEYELEDEELMELVLAMYGDVPTEDESSWVPHEDSVARCNAVWQKIAEARNLDWTSVLPSDKGERYFCAYMRSEESSDVSEKNVYPITSDEEFYKELERRKRSTRCCCDECGTRYQFDNINMCKRCGRVLCHKCVQDPENPKVKRACMCGGEMD